MTQEKAGKWVKEKYPNHPTPEILIEAYMAGTTSMVDYLNQENKKKEDRIKKKKAEFAERLKPFLGVYDKDMLNEFWSYWCEADLKSGKLRWEKEKTFEIDLRLKKWASNNFGSKKPNEPPEKKYKAG